MGPYVVSRIVCTVLALLTAFASQYWDSVCNESHVLGLQVNLGLRRDPSGVDLKTGVCWQKEGGQKTMLTVGWRFWL